MNQLTINELMLWKTADFKHKLLDVRRDSARLSSGTDITGATWHNPAQWLDWKDKLQIDAPIVVYCAHGHEISQGLVAALCAMGHDARILVGGMTAWQAAGFPVSTHARVDPAMAESAP